MTKQEQREAFEAARRELLEACERAEKREHTKRKSVVCKRFSGGRGEAA